MKKNVIVVKEGKGFKVLVDYIQRGAVYGSKEIAENEAAKLRKDFIG